MHTTTISGRLHGRGARIAVSAIIAAFLAVLAVPALTSTPASAHGWITNPPSRQDHCADGTTSFSCGGISYEPQSVEAPKGSMLCSGGSGFDVLDDESLPWPRTNVSNSVTLQWKLTAAHATSTWEYFVDGQLWATYDQGGQQPPSNIQHTLTGLPQGDHTILARWNVADTPMAFYNCVDITVGGSTSTPTPTPTDTSTPTPTPTPTTPGECAAAWNADTQYNGGDVVSYNGTEWSAKWWTQGETPGEQWGPWVDQGACGSSSPTPTPTGTATSTPTPTATATSTPSPTPTSTTTPVCDAPAYVAGEVYIGGDLVTYDNQLWKARWWNQNQAPSAAEPWGPWEIVTC
ncbi:lytic polysaccharide monooxygenase [Demequina sp. B12]|uniref:lytic polysaccharide monooxygenase n=1 Tax=Demequina sp. B12 TaxID=2992757 RepID=UPI00237B228C|nr:lytic polysaccharide monooxygenase [Demequina sp. B12]MDE0572239.1 lytic polysaccharide monooxygenase [Demequina sp. B12]